MTTILLTAAAAFAALAIADFRRAVLIYVGLYQIVPITLSVDLGTSLPLVTMTRLLLLPLLAVFMVRVVTGRSRLDGVPLWLAFAFYGVALFAANLLSEFHNSSGTLRVFSFVTEEWLVFVMAACVMRTREDGEAALTWLMAGAVLTFAFAAFELTQDQNPLLTMAQGGRENLIYDYSLERRFGLRRASSLFRNPLDYGIYLSLLLPVAAAWRVDARGRKRRMTTVVLVGGVVALVLTVSRTSVYALIVSALAYLALRRHWAALLRVVGGTVAVVLVLSLVFQFPLLDYLYRSALAPEQFQGDLGGSSLSSLATVTANHLRLFLEHPLFGCGLSTLPPNDAGAGLDPDKLGYGEQGITYLLVEAGALGLGAFLILVGAIAARLRRGWHGSASAFGVRLNLGILCALAGWFVSVELAGIWHFSLVLVLAAIAFRMQAVPEPAAPAPAVHPVEAVR